jgi:purine-binding chemotaxis protein CheW
MSEHKSYCTFTLDGLTCGVEVLRVQEVIRYQQMTQVPLADRVVAGLINLRGQVVSAIDLRLRLGLTMRDETSEPMNVVVRTSEGPVSMLVDEIGDVIDADPGSFESAPDTLNSTLRELVSGVYKLDGSLLLVLDIDRALELGELVEAGR